VARRSGDGRARFDSLEVRYYVRSGPDFLQERRDLVVEMPRLAEALHDRELTLRALRCQLHLLLEQGDIVGVEATIATYARIARDLRQPVCLWEAQTLRAMRTLLQGWIAAGETPALAAFRARRAANEPDAFTAFANQINVVRREQGRAAELIAGSRQLIDRYPGLLAHRPRTATAPATRDTPAASEKFEAFALRLFTDIPRDALWPIAICALAEAAAYLDDAPCASALYDLLLPYAGRAVVTGESSACEGAISRRPA
jgi:hypothetical protein